MTIRLSLFLSLFTMLSWPGALGSQDSTQTGNPVPRPFVKIYANLYSGLTDADRSAAFEVRRAYFGYKTDLNDRFSAEVKLDIGSPNDISEYSRIRRYAYFKTAAFYYRTDKCFFKFGIIDIDLFKLEEDLWDHRYIAKSFMDIHRFGDIADLGAGFAYTFTDFLSADVSVSNGEGYTNLQRDNAFKTGLGLSLTPVENFLIRFFADYTETTEKQMTLSSFITYEMERTTWGIEYDYKINRDFVRDHDQYGVSGFLSYRIGRKAEAFCRYDRLTSKITDDENRPWNLNDDGSALFGGFQYRFTDGLRAALSYRDWVPLAANLDNQRYLYLNFEIRF